MNKNYHFLVRKGLLPTKLKVTSATRMLSSCNTFVNVGFLHIMVKINWKAVFG